ncbi:MAG TPA: type IV pilus secretin PilQ [Vicinamibacterales bacterium]|nr:type IV pilus secretin PilQ [Vicinamibacterales bacterium]
MKRGLALCLTVVTAGTLLRAAPPAAPGIEGPRLKAISSRMHNKGASLVIEATDPVGYVASRPDPLTIAVDFRNVSGDGVQNSVTADPSSPITAVTVEPIDALGVPVSRVRVTLSEPVAHQVRSDRNSIVVELDKPTGRPYVRPVVLEQNSGTVSVPDAMKALEVAQAQTPVAADPLAALGLTGSPVESSEPAAGTAALNVRTPPAAQQPTAVAAAAQPGPLQAQPAQDPGAPGPAATRFTGNPISLDFQGADLRAVLRSFSEISGLNMVIDPRVTGTVDVALRDVPWDQALDIILRANGLGYRLDGTIVRIAPVGVFTAEDRAQGAAAAAAADAGQLTTFTRQLSYSRGEEIVALLKQANVLSSRGTSFVDARTNTLIITDLQERVTNATELIDTIDKAQPQVEIEARIVQTTKTFARALGIQWGFTGNVAPTLGNTTNLAFPNSGTLTGTAPPTLATGTPPVGTAVNLPVPGANSAVGLTMGSINGAFNLDVALTALERNGNGRLLSTPKVSTLNNVAAEMTQGIQIPIQTATNNTVTVQFKDAALSLKVTPQITAANTVIMQIALENATPDFGRQVNGIPPINTQRAITTVLVLDGQTTVIGGIYTANATNTRDQTPGLGSIPLLGWLFKRDSVTDENSELLIFITPKIIKT